MSATLPEARAAIAALARRHAMAHAQGATWLIALSGGLDSRALLDLCVTYRRSNPDTAPRLITAHVHHHLRESADLDASFCEALCDALPEVLEHHTIHLDPSRWSGSTQQAARKTRYEALSGLAVECGASAILTGHHLDDAMETFVMHAARGSGARGLSSLARQITRPPHATAALPEHVELCRPLIDASREAIVNHARAHGLTWVEDPTNNQSTYTRNSIRHELLPLLEDVHGNGHKGWLRTLNHLIEEADFIDASLDALWRRAAHANWPLEGAIFIQRDALLDVHPFLIKRLALRAHRAVASARAPDESQLVALVRMCLTPEARPSTLPLPGARAEQDSHGVVLLPTQGRASRGWFDEAPLAVHIPLHERSGQLDWFQGSIVWSANAGSCASDEAWIRGAHPGERITAHDQQKGGAPIKEILRQRGVPAWRRHLWPCLVLKKAGEDEPQVVHVLDTPTHHSGRVASQREGQMWMIQFVERAPWERSS